MRFDALMYQIELAYLMNNRYMKGYRDLTNKVKGISNVANIPEIQVHSDLINKILHTDYLDNSGINEFEEIREKLRSLMKYLPKGKISKYDTNFEDDNSFYSNGMSQNLIKLTWKIIKRRLNIILSSINKTIQPS